MPINCGADSQNEKTVLNYPSVCFYEKLKIDSDCVFMHRKYKETLMSKILIIEDEKNLARFVELELKHEGYETEVHFNGPYRFWKQP